MDEIRNILGDKSIFVNFFRIIILKREAAKRQILLNLALQGFVLNNSCEIMKFETKEKDLIRSLHRHFREDKLRFEKKFLITKLPGLVKYFANGYEVNPKRILPKLKLVKANTEYSDLFRLATLLWSVPVSNGFGRRLRFLVFDDSNGKLIGLFALGDPVFNLKARDSVIGWDQALRRDHLYNIMDIYVAGAVPPYANLLCGKLISMLSASDDVRHIVWNKYSNTTSIITKQNKIPHLVLLTTLSALGRSSQYNKIIYHNKKMFFKVGNTSGWGHFHLSNSTFELMRKYLISVNHPIVKKNRFGHGPNWKIRTIRTCLELLDLPTNMLNHGIEREVYFCPLSVNYFEYLNGNSNSPEYIGYPSTEVVKFFKDRWLIPRSERCSGYQKVLATDTLKELIKLT